MPNGGCFTSGLWVISIKFTIWLQINFFVTQVNEHTNCFNGQIATKSDMFTHLIDDSFFIETLKHFATKMKQLFVFTDNRFIIECLKWCLILLIPTDYEKNTILLQYSTVLLQYSPLHTVVARELSKDLMERQGLGLKIRSEILVHISSLKFVDIWKRKTYHPSRYPSKWSKTIWVGESGLPHQKLSAFVNIYHYGISGLPPSQYLFTWS